MEASTSHVDRPKDDEIVVAQLCQSLFGETSRPGMEKTLDEKTISEIGTYLISAFLDSGFAPDDYKNMLRIIKCDAEEIRTDK